MKDINYYLDLAYTIILKKKKDDYYEVRIAELDGCMSHGKTIEETMEMIEDAKRCWIKAGLEDGDFIPEPEDDYLSEVIRLYDLHLESKVSSKKEAVIG